MNAVVISHEKEATQRLFARVKYMIDHMEVRPLIDIDSKNMITFPKRNSTFYIGTAGAKSFGRGDTITHLHCSEVAFWPHFDMIWGGLLEAVTPDGIIVVETTPNGIANPAYDMWQAAKLADNEFTGFFYPWYFHDENRLESPVEGELFPHELELIAKAATLGFTVDRYQIAWRRKKLAISVDNPTPSAKALRNFQQEHAEDDISCFLQTGRPVFEAKFLKVNAVQKEPEPGHTYTVAADVAEGLVDGDFDYAFVIDDETGEQVAWLHGTYTPGRWGELLVELATKYNDALLVIERNNHGHATILKCQDLFYLNLYVHEDSKYGWPTNAKTKPVMIDNLEEAIRLGHMKICDAALVDECLTFQYNDRGSAEAQTGKHDDRVMAAAIGWAVRCLPKSVGFTHKPKGF